MPLAGINAKAHMKVSIGLCRLGLDGPAEPDVSRVEPQAVGAVDVEVRSLQAVTNADGEGAASGEIETPGSGSIQNRMRL